MDVLPKFIGLILFPFVGAFALLLLSKLSWKPKEPRFVDGIKCISSKDTIGWMCINYFISGSLIVFVVIASYKKEIPLLIVISLSVLLVFNVITGVVWKYAMVTLSGDNLIVTSILNKTTIAMLEVDSVTQDYIKEITPRIKICLKNKTIFNRNILFIPVNEQIIDELLSLLKKE